MLEGTGVLSSIKTDLLPPHGENQQDLVDIESSSNPNYEKKSSQAYIRGNPSRVVLSKKQYENIQNA